MNTASRVTIAALGLLIAVSAHAAIGNLVDHYPAPLVSHEKLTVCIYSVHKAKVTVYVVGKCPARIEVKGKQ